MRHLIVRSRNTSCRKLRELIVPIRTLYRMGSTTPIGNIFRRNVPYIEINTVRGCEISSNKRKMKLAFDEAEIHTAQWFTCENKRHGANIIKHKLLKWRTPIIAKRINSSRGRGIYLIRNEMDFMSMPDDVQNYVFEKYYSYTKEYRLHVSKFGCFYASRKMLRGNSTVRWHRHSENSVFFNENNPQFDKPNTWNIIIRDCQKVLNTIGLDIAAFDVKVSRTGEFIIMESNSAPALGDAGIEKYKLELKRIIEDKIK